jgi:hypothetical protein
VGDNVPVDSEALLVTDFMNLKIKLVQFFGGAHRSRVCVRVFICVSVRTYISIYVYNILLKKVSWQQKKKVSRTTYTACCSPQGQSEDTHKVAEQNMHHISGNIVP